MARWLSRASEHEQVEALLSTYLDGRASELERAFVERHLGSCVDCARSLATLRATVTAVQAMPRVRASRSFALPRSMAQQPRPVPWTFPLLQAATAAAAILFVLAVGADFVRGMAFHAAAPQMAAPAALPPTTIAMESMPTSAPQKAAPAVIGKPTLATPAPTPTPQAPGTSTPAAAARAMSPSTPVEPPVEQPLTSTGIGGEVSAGGEAPIAAPAVPTREPAFKANELTTSTVESDGSASTPAAVAGQPSPASSLNVQATSAPTQFARGPAPRPSAAVLVSPAQRPTINLFRVAEGALAVLAIVSGAAAWVVRRRSR